jgi:hypothetical protein
LWQPIESRVFCDANYSELAVAISGGKMSPWKAMQTLRRYYREDEFSSKVFFEELVRYLDDVLTDMEAPPGWRYKQKRWKKIGLTYKDSMLFSLFCQMQIESQDAEEIRNWLLDRKNTRKMLGFRKLPNEETIMEFLTDLDYPWRSLVFLRVVAKMKEDGNPKAEHLAETPDHVRPRLDAASS